MLIVTVYSPLYTGKSILHSFKLALGLVQMQIDPTGSNSR